MGVSTTGANTDHAANATRLWPAQNASSRAENESSPENNDDEGNFSDGVRADDDANSAVDDNTAEVSN